MQQGVTLGQSEEPEEESENVAPVDEDMDK